MQLPAQRPPAHERSAWAKMLRRSLREVEMRGMAAA